MNADGTYAVYPARQWQSVRERLATGAAPLAPEADSDGFAIGSAALLLAEMGDPNLTPFYAYADKYLSPTWKNGGLYYPRNSRLYDAEGNPTAIGSGVGNAFLAYGRLNVRDGLHTMYNRPWVAAVFAQPRVTEIDDVDVSRARFLSDRNALFLSLRSYTGSGREHCQLLIANAVRPGQWELRLDNNPVARGTGDAIAASELPSLQFEGTSLRMQLPVSTGVDVELAWS